MIRRALRRDDLCIPSACEDAIEIRDEAGDLIRRERCEHCGLDRLDTEILSAPVLHRAFDYDFALQAGIRLTLEDLTIEEFHAIKVLRIERDKHQQEQTKKASRNG